MAVDKKINKENKSTRMAPVKKIGTRQACKAANDQENSSVAQTSKAFVGENATARQEKKRSASDMDPSLEENVTYKRKAFGDLTNATRPAKMTVSQQQEGKKTVLTSISAKIASKANTKQSTKTTVPNKTTKAFQGAKTSVANVLKRSNNTISAKNNSKVKIVQPANKEVLSASDVLSQVAVKKEEKELPQQVLESLTSSQETTTSSVQSSQKSIKAESVDSGLPSTECSFTTTSSQDNLPSVDLSSTESLVERKIIRAVDVDQDPNVVSEYAESIFRNMRKREQYYLLNKYFSSPGCECTPNMRAILVDWLVEVQENFELYHETLYLGVKLVDRYLQAVPKTGKDKLQLVGAAAMMIACKIEERHPPPVDDFQFICDDAYTHPEFVKMEMQICRALGFDIGTPIPYRFLRRFARVAGATMEVLTLSRFILETSLMEYEVVDSPPSQLAASCLALAIKMKNAGEWDATLQHHTSYKYEQLVPIMKKLNKTIKGTISGKLQTIRNKYSHEIFYSVAKLPTIDDSQIEPEAVEPKIEVKDEEEEPKETSSEADLFST